MKALFLYIPCPDARSARRLARGLLAEKCVACAQLINSQSMYLWSNTVRKEKETILLVKTLPSKEKRVRSFIERKHPYDIPCIASFRSDVNAAYGAWMKEVMEKI